MKTFPQRALYMLLESYA